MKLYGTTLPPTQKWWIYGPFCAFILIQATLLGAANNPRAGPFQVAFKTGNKCPLKDRGEKELIHFEDKIVEVSRDYVYLLTNATFDIPLSDEIKGVIKMSKMTSEGWKDNFFVGDMGGVCTAARIYLPSMYHDFARQVKKKKCPVPAGTYNNIKIDLSNATVAGLKTMTYNEYRARFYAKRNGETIRCLEIYVSVTPKRKIQDPDSHVHV